MEILSRCRLALIVNGEHLLTRYLIIIILLLLLLPSYSARAGELEGLLSTCAAHTSDHVGQSECLETKASTSEITLKSSESALLESISKRDEEPDDIATMKKTLRAGTASFRVYRDKECEFYASMAAGGNAAGDLRLACTATLNTKRAEQLQWATENWRRR